MIKVKSSGDVETRGKSRTVTTNSTLKITDKTNSCEEVIKNVTKNSKFGKKSEQKLEQKQKDLLAIKKKINNLYKSKSEKFVDDSKTYNLDINKNFSSITLKSDDSSILQNEQDTILISKLDDINEDLENDIISHIKQESCVLLSDLSKIFKVDIVLLYQFLNSLSTDKLFGFINGDTYLYLSDEAIQVLFC
jgi:hypothetical protein